MEWKFRTPPLQLHLHLYNLNNVSYIYIFVDSSSKIPVCISYQSVTMYHWLKAEYRWWIQNYCLSLNNQSSNRIQLYTNAWFGRKLNPSICNITNIFLLFISSVATLPLSCQHAILSQPQNQQLRNIAQCFCKNVQTLFYTFPYFQVVVQNFDGSIVVFSRASTCSVLTWRILLCVQFTV